MNKIYVAGPLFSQAERHFNDFLNKFLEDMNYAICFSKKETFSYAIAEGMCKGLKPIIHDFYGAEDIWDKKYIWDTIDEAIKMTINDDYNPYEYRKYITDKYSLNNMLARFNEKILPSR